MIAHPSNISLFLEEPSLQDKAKLISEKLGIDIVYTKPEKLCLKLNSYGLFLEEGDLSMQGDFTESLKRLTHANLTHELLVKSAKVKGVESPVLIDATAGMGEDSLLLAAAGFRVELYESNPIIAALLADTLDRASKNLELADIVSRMHLHFEDSIEAMKKLDYTPDVILLDPMFPERKKSGLIKKKFQLMQQLEHPCANEEELFFAAKFANPKKIVIKRPAKGPCLAGVKPSYSIDGKAIRYDCIIL